MCTWCKCNIPVHNAGILCVCRADLEFSSSNHRCQQGHDVAGKAGKGKAASFAVKQLGKSGISNKFVHLRKIAQHPLLVRNLYSDSRVQRLATVAYNRLTFNMLHSSSCILTGSAEFSCAGSAIASAAPCLYLVLANLPANHNKTSLTVPSF